MSRLHIRFIDLDRFCSDGTTALLVARLVFAYNDISAANICLTRTYDDESKIHSHMFRGIVNYLIRVQCGHLNEAACLIKEVDNDTSLMTVLDRCSDTAKEAFRMVRSFAYQENPYGKWFKFFGQIRNNLAFHYGSLGNKAITRALSAKSIPSRHSSVTTGGDINLDRFNLGDDMADAIMFHQIMHITPGEIAKHGDPLIKEGSDLAKGFITFSGELIYRYLDDFCI